MSLIADALARATPPRSRGSGFEDYANRAFRALSAQPRLSVLIPFCEDEVGPLLESLFVAASGHGSQVEVVVGDDASSDPTLAAGVRERLDRARAPARLLRAARRLGRAALRNRLAAQARGRFLLFIDADMRCPGPAFLESWLGHCDADGPAVAFGGYALPEGGPENDPLMAYECRHDQCRPAAARRLRPWQYLYAGNLFLRRDIALAHPFDEGFRRWGWEDVELGMRLAEHCTITHIDNPVVRSRLARTEAFCSRLAESVESFARLVGRHPEKASLMPLFRASRLLAGLPAKAASAALLRRLAEGRVLSLPLPVRLGALKLYRALLYAPVHANRARPVPVVPPGRNRPAVTARP